jgi:uncharacterized membrane protein
VRVGRVLLGRLFIGGGGAHFVLTRAYPGIVPDYRLIYWVLHYTRKQLQ